MREKDNKRINNQSLKNSQSSFTLIELLIVVAILYITLILFVV
jgi:competence protein ComGC